MSGHKVGRKRFENRGQIAERDRSYQRRQLAEAERGLRDVPEPPESGERRRANGVAKYSKTMPAVVATSVEPGDRRMPWGVCPGCHTDAALPPFGDGLCFLCATDGPAGERTPTGGAVDEEELCFAAPVDDDEEEEDGGTTCKSGELHDTCWPDAV